MTTSFIGASIHRHHLQVIVASRDRHGQRVDRPVRTACLDRVKALLANWAGGFSVSSGHGGWIDGTGHLIEEPVIVVEAYGKQAVSLSMLDELVEMLLDELDQESVALINNGALLLCNSASFKQEHHSNVHQLGAYHWGGRHAA